MTGFYAPLCVVMLLAFLAGLVRIYRGPTAADRMLAATLMTSTAVGATLLIGRVLDEPAMQHAALIIVLLAALSVVTFVRIDPTSGGDEAP